MEDAMIKKLTRKTLLLKYKFMCMDENCTAVQDAGLLVVASYTSPMLYTVYDLIRTCTDSVEIYSLNAYL